MGGRGSALAHPSARAAQRGARGYAAWYVRVGAAMKNSSWAAVGMGMVGFDVEGEALASRRSWVLHGKSACESRHLLSLVCCIKLMLIMRGRLGIHRVLAL